MTRNRVALRIVVIYALVGCLWILLSDRLLALFVQDPQSITALQTAKGWFYVLATACMLYALIQAHIAAIHKAQEALRQNEELFRAAVNNLPDIFVMLDADLRIRFVNSKAMEVSGLSEKQLLGRTEDEIYPRELTDQSGPLLRRTVETRSPQEKEVIFPSPRGPMTVTAHTVPLLGTNGKLRRILLIAHDITEQRKAEETQRELEAHKREFYRRTILAATEGKLVITEREEIREIAGPALRAWRIQRGENLGMVRSDIARLAQSAGMEESRIFDLVLAVGEATTNAYKHAGGGEVTYHRVDDAPMVVVCDHGPGIDAIVLPEVALKRGYTTAESLGMGYKAMLSIADKVYLATGPWGTTVGIQMSLHAPPKPAVRPLLPDTW